MRLDPNTHAIFVPVEVYHDGEYRAIQMLVDTGATFVSVPPDFAESLGHDLSQATRHITLQTANGLRDAPLITVQRIRVLGVDANDVDAVCMTLPSENKLRGLLGLSFLKHFDMDVHFRRRVLRIR
ncbi:MAG: retropepsin-like aspartic protease [SAR202 cluster bacterium]|jgi:aspartyl protease family protein|nr:retropepsin-like aspartic protease [SAR202 cluster bacterium]MDP6714105.1 retropepsin-like aspartic protease [SAR202 cluster bacterium]